MSKPDENISQNEVLHYGKGSNKKGGLHTKSTLILGNRVVKAAGILFYYETEDEFQKKHYKFLVLERLSKNKRLTWEDFGGKVEKTDRTVYDTAIRETLEESNNYFTYEYLNNHIRHTKYIWNDNCCYCVF